MSARYIKKAELYNPELFKCLVDFFVMYWASKGHCNSALGQQRATFMNKDWVTKEIAETLLMKENQDTLQKAVDEANKILERDHN